MLISTAVSLMKTFLEAPILALYLTRWVASKTSSLTYSMVEGQEAAELALETQISAAAVSEEALAEAMGNRALEALGVKVSAVLKRDKMLNTHSK